MRVARGTLSPQGSAGTHSGSERAELVVSSAFPWAQEDKDQDWHRYPPWMGCLLSKSLKNG